MRIIILMPATNTENFSLFDEETSRKQQEIETRTWDESGAKREQFFHKELGDFIRENVKVSRDGMFLELLPEAKDISFIAFTMDLARINDIAQHEKTNGIIKETVSSVGSILEKIPGAEPAIYREKGGDFTISADVLPKTLEQLVSQLKENKIPLGEGISPEQLSVTSIRLEDIVEIYNTVRQNLASSQTVEVYDDIIFSPQKALGNILVKALSFNREYQKYIDVSSNFRNKYQEDNPSEEATVFYNKYLARMFNGSSINSAEDLASSDWESVKDACLEQAREAVFSEAGKSTQVVLQTIENQYVRGIIEKSWNMPHEIGRSTTEISDDRNREKLELEFSNQLAFYRTEQKVQFDRQQAILDELNKVKGTDDLYKGYAISLIEELIERGAYPDEIKEKVRESARFLPIHEDVNERWVHETRIHRFLEVAEKELELQHLKFDGLAGLPNNTEFNKALRKRVQEGQEFSIIKYDVAFLKYHNRAKRPTGNLALQKSSWLMEQAGNQMEENGVNTEEFRTGGDEFTVIVDGGNKEVEQFLMKMEILGAEKDTMNIQHNLVIPHPEAKKEFAPEELRLNFGFCSFSYAKKAAQNPENPFITMEFQLEIADSALFYNKAQDRFSFLTKRYLDLEEKVPYTHPLPEDSVYLGWKQFEALFAASGKAIQGKSIEELKVYADLVKNLSGYPDNIDNSEMSKLFEQFTGSETTITSRRAFNPVEEAIIGTTVNEAV